MLKNKKSKVLRMRGTSSHGWGHKKKHRGAGNRGGKGLSGTGARGDAQKPGLLSNAKSLLQKIAAKKGVKLSKIKAGSSYFGKKGFTSIKKSKQNVLSLNYIENNFEALVEKGIIIKEKEGFVFNTTLVKYDKILGKGNFSKKVKLIVKEISESAKLKVEAVGGTVVVLNKKVESSKE